MEDATRRNGAALLRAGAHAVKLEGAGPGILSAVCALVKMGVPVVGDLGFTPQSALNFSGVVQGKTSGAAGRLLQGAHGIERTIRPMLREVARRVTKVLSIPTISIGAGAGCDGQILVWHDLARLTPGPPLRFVERYAEALAILREAAWGFVGEVHSGASRPKNTAGRCLRPSWRSGRRGVKPERALSRPPHVSIPR